MFPSFLISKGHDVLHKWKARCKYGLELHDLLRPPYSWHTLVARVPYFVRQRPHVSQIGTGFTRCSRDLARRPQNHRTALREATRAWGADIPYALKVIRTALLQLHCDPHDRTIQKPCVRL